MALSSRLTCTIFFALLVGSIALYMLISLSALQQRQAELDAYRRPAVKATADRRVLQPSPAVPAAAKQWANLDVVVVEEHHEALPYWAASRPALKSALLVHIDAHPDFALPREMPQDATPAAGSDSTEDSSPAAYVSIANNDEFIAQACLMDIVSTVVWIYPKWDAKGPRHKRRRFPSHVTAVGVGRTSEGGVCDCQSRPTELTFDNITRAWAIPIDGQKRACQDSDDDKIDPEECHILRSCTLITVSEDALRKLQGAQLDGWNRFLQSYPQAILDIDEDFFGQVTVVSRVSRALSPDMLKRLDARLKHLCPSREAGIEAKANDAFGLAAKLVRECKDNGQSECGAQKELESFDCDGDGSAAASIVRLLMDLSDAQLEVLAVTGICLTTSPATADSEPFRLRICAEGRENEKDQLDTDLSEAEAFLAEDHVAVSQRLTAFAEWMPPRVLEPRAYALATVCRSVRDGYTPRRVWDMIESRLLQTVSGRHRFDRFLMGGRAGRPS